MPPKCEVQSLDSRTHAKPSTCVHTYNPRDALGDGRAETGGSLDLVGSYPGVQSNRQNRFCLKTVGEVKINT